MAVAAAKVVESHPWDQRPGESAKAFRAFRVYLELGPERTLGAASRQFYGSGKTGAKPERSRNGASGQIAEWAARFGWRERVEVYDAHLAKVEADAKLKLAERQRAKWAEREEKRLEENWQSATQLKLRALQMLQYPLEQTTIEKKSTGPNGEQIVEITIVEPIGWRLRDAAWFLKTAAELEQATLVSVADRDTPDADPTPAEAITDQVRADAQRRLEEWRRQMRERLADLDAGPPGVTAHES